MKTIKLKVYSPLLSGQKIATADVKSTWTESLSITCGIELPYPEDYYIHSLTYGQAKKKGWKAELYETIGTSIAQFSNKKSQYSVWVRRKTRLSSSGDEIEIVNVTQRQLLSFLRDLLGDLF